MYDIRGDPDQVAEVANEHEDVSTLSTMEHGSHQDSSTIEKYKEGIAILKQAFPTFPEHEIANFLEYHDVSSIRHVTRSYPSKEADVHTV